MASEKKKPAGAALVMIDDDALAALLNLPEGVYIHHSFVPHATYGRSLGFVLWTEREGVLPPVELGKEVQDISWRFRFEQDYHDGKRWLRAVGLPEWDTPEEEGAADGE